MKRKFLLPMVILSVSAIGLTAGTWATWTDTESSQPNTVAAGGLTLGVDNNHITASNLIPGGTCGDTTITVTNNGSVAGNISMKFVIDSDDENTLTAPEIAASDPGGSGVGQGELSQYLNMQVDSIAGLPNTLSNLNNVNFSDGSPTPLGASGDTRAYHVTACVPSGASNVIQTDSVSFHIDFTITQA